MANYSEVKERQQKEFNALPVAYGFGTGGAARIMEKLNATEDEIIYIGAGGYMRKDQSQLYIDLIKKHCDEDRENRKDPDFVYQMFRYELSNHEYSYTGELDDTLSACGLSLQQVQDSEMLTAQLKRAGAYIWW